MRSGTPVHPCPMSEWRCGLQARRPAGVQKCGCRTAPSHLTFVTRSNLSRQGSGVAVPSSHSSSSSSASCTAAQRQCRQNAAYLARCVSAAGQLASAVASPPAPGLGTLTKPYFQTLVDANVGLTDQEGSRAVDVSAAASGVRAPRRASGQGLTGACGGRRSATGPPPPPFIGRTALGAAIRRARPARGPNLPDAMPLSVQLLLSFV